MRILTRSMKHNLFIILVLINIAASLQKYDEITKLGETSLMSGEEEVIDISDEKYKQYFDDIKEILSNYTIFESNNTKNYSAHQLIKVFSSSLSSTETNKTLSTNLLIRELNASEYFLFQIHKTYQNTINSLDMAINSDDSEVKISQNATLFNPQSEKNHESFIELTRRLLDFKEMGNKEIAFYKGINEHSCSRHAFSISIGEVHFLTVCVLRERNADYAFEVGYLDSKATLAKNISEYHTVYFFNTKKETFEIFNLRSDNVVSNFTKAEDENKLMNDYYAFMKEKGLVPENSKIDPDLNDYSEGGFNLVVRRSLIGIILTGVICSVLYIGLFIFAKMNKKKPNDGYDSFE